MTEQFTIQLSRREVRATMLALRLLKMQVECDLLDLNFIGLPGLTADEVRDLFARFAQTPQAESDRSPLPIPPDIVIIREDYVPPRKRPSQITEGMIKKGGLNPPNDSDWRPPAPGGSGGSQ